MYVKKFSFILILCIAFTALLTGCMPKPPAETEAAEDLNQSDAVVMTISGIKESLPVDTLTIDKSQVEKKEATYWCSAKQSNDYYACDTSYVLEYAYYDKGGWMLENYDMTSASEITPLKGLNEDVFRDAFSEKHHTVEVVAHDTDLDAKTDHLVFRLSDPADDVTSTGEITLDYVFASDMWTRTSWSVLPDQSVVTASKRIRRTAAIRILQTCS